MQDFSAMHGALLRWYDLQGRELPWRVRPKDRARGMSPNPYKIWLSEIMSQQTTLAHATPYWERFTAEFPTVIDLANCERETVLSMWAGLGYYARARNLHKCAVTVRDEYQGIFPVDEASLLKLPGIGPYTAATIAAICGDQPTNIVDGNVERVISRIFTYEDPLPKGKKGLRNLAATLVKDERPGDYGQALMDLGATICTVKNPKCDTCPWTQWCKSHCEGTQTNYPKKVKKTPRPIRYGYAYILRSGGNFLVERRGDKGLLGGMLGLPTSEWGDKSIDHSAAPIARNWQKLGQVKHIFTHFDLRLDVFFADVEAENLSHLDQNSLIWTQDASALPTVFRKAVRLAMSEP